MDYNRYLARISRDAIGRYDVTRLFDEHEMLEAIVEDFAAPFRDDQIDAVPASKR